MPHAAASEEPPEGGSPLVTSTVNGNNVSGFYHYQPAGSDLVGSVTGDAYQATGVTQSPFHGSLQNGLYTTTFINNFRLIGQGPGNNYLVHETFHLTFNAKGDVTVDHDLFSVDCRITRSCDHSFDGRPPLGRRRAW